MTNALLEINESVGRYVRGPIVNNNVPIGSSEAAFTCTYIVIYLHVT